MQRKEAAEKVERKDRGSDVLRRKLRLKREQLRRKANRGNLLAFAEYNNKKYRANWHHEAIANTIQGFLADPNRKKMMLFVPPQHGKSELASVMTPAFCLGKYPTWKTVIASYSADLADSFAGRVKDMAETVDFQAVFPGTTIKGKTKEFKNQQNGGVKSVGVRGGLSGRSVDLAIIDDPIKDYIEAESPRTREVIWNWYTSVIQTRLHNDSKVILIMTRWHEDDLAGRLLEREPDEWEVVKFAAIKEPHYTHPDDPRETGEALWPVKHNLAKLEAFRRLDASMFESLQQQNPTSPEGNKIKRAWFQFCEAKEVPASVVWDLWVDGAYTENTKNDPTGFLVAGYSPMTNTLYIALATDAYMEITECLDRTVEIAKLHGLGPRSRVRYEPKASGKSMRQLMKAKSRTLSPVEIKGRMVASGKEGRATVAAPKIHAGKVVLVRGTWNERYLSQMCGYPKAAHDEYIDLTGYACYHHFDRQQAGVYN